MILLDAAEDFVLGGSDIDAAGTIRGFASMDEEAVRITARRNLCATDGMKRYAIVAPVSGVSRVVFSRKIPSSSDLAHLMRQDGVDSRRYRTTIWNARISYSVAT